MKSILLSAFEQIKNTGVKHVHYKVCSTFDSSDEIGSIGQAIDCGAEIFNNNIIPVLGGMPALGRYCVFGNLFARLGTSGNGNIYRLDRHPSMSNHPVTPAMEADLRLLLGSQTNKKIGLIDITKLEEPIESMNKNNEDAEVIMIDALYNHQLLKIGEWIDQQQNNKPLFSVGSSGIEMALGQHWNSTGKLKPFNQWPSVGIANPLLVVSGSRSPVTLAQIAWAKENGFEEVLIDATKVDTDEVDSTLQEKINKLLSEKKNVIAHTGAKQLAQLSSEKLGTLLGEIVKNAATTQLIKRVVIAGGDTSSYAARAIDIEAVEMIASLVSGAPLCKAISSNEFINGLEVNFKGGQVGGEEYFEILRRGET